MNIRCNVISDVGCKRTNNEDMALLLGQQIRDDDFNFSFELADDSRLTAIVADGMGGYDKGEVASQMATDSFDQFFTDLPDDLDTNSLIMAIKQWAGETNQAILQAAQGTGMGCTFCGLITFRGEAYILNMGDSRIYRLRGDLMKQLSTDHSERNRLHDDTVPSNLIYNAFGVEGAFIDISHTRIIADDIFLICSDGLTDMVDDSTIEAILHTNDDKAKQLVEAAKRAGGDDNITVILLEFTE